MTMTVDEVSGMSAITLARMAAATHGAELLTFRFSEVWIIVHHNSSPNDVNVRDLHPRINPNTDERR